MSLCVKCPVSGQCFLTHALTAEVIRWGEFRRTADVSVNACSVYDEVTVQGYVEGAPVSVLYKGEWRTGLVKTPPVQEHDGNFVEIVLDDGTEVAFAVQSGNVKLETV